MTTRASIAADGRSSYIVTVSFFDEDGDAVVPTSIHWSLQTTDGTIVNSRSNVAVATPLSAITIVLTGSDLALLDQANTSEIRRLVVAALYDSTLGTGLKLVGVYEFRVLNTWSTGQLPSVSPSASRSPSASAS